MRQVETGWIDKLSDHINNSIAKRLEAGQASIKIKFNELYQDVQNCAECKILTISYQFLFLA